MNSNKLVVITSFPPQGIVHDKSVVGIASYAKNTLLGLKKYDNELEISVLAENLGRQEVYSDKGIVVKRVWKRGAISIFPRLLSEILALKNTKNILIEFEVAMFGDFKYLLPFPIFLLCLILIGKKVTVVSHQVIADIGELSGHLNLHSRLKTTLLNWTIHLFYKMLLCLTFQVVVFDKILKDKLVHFGNSHKIKVIPHGVEQFKHTFTKQTAREKLKLSNKDFVLLYFGYLAWYKGTDLLVEQFAKLKAANPDMRLIIAGGPNPNHLNKTYYQNYIHQIENTCNKQGILLTGFIDEKDIPLYFEAADVVILPYRILMSASGPLSIAFSFKKPFIVSEALTGMYESEDLREALEKLHIDKSDLIFKDDLAQKLNKFKNDPSFKERTEQLAEELAQERNWDLIGKAYAEILF